MSVVVASNLAIFSDGSGGSNQNHLIYASNQQRWWLFSINTKTATVVNTYVSSSNDLTTATWSAGTSSSAFPSSFALLSTDDQRYMGCIGFANGATDVAHISVSGTVSGGTTAINHARATFTGASSITWESWVQTVDGDPSGIAGLEGNALGIGTDGRIHEGSKALDSGADANIRRSTNADTGATWTNAWGANAITDSSMVNTCNSYAFAQLASAAMLVVYDNGGAASPNCTGLRSNKYTSGATWPTSGSGDVGIGSTTQDVNDWCLCTVDSTHIYAFRRSGSNTFVWRKYSGTAWSTPANGVPNQNHKAGSGLFAATDGTDLYLFLLDSASNQPVQYVKCSAANGTTPTWSTWTQLEAAGSTARNCISGYPVVANNQIGVIFTAVNGSNFDIVVTALALTTNLLVGTAAGTSSASAIGASLVAEPGTASATSSATGVGVLAKLSPFTAAGTSAASGIGAKLAISTATASGTSSATGVGVLAKLSPFTAAGTSTASGISAVLAISTATASGTSSATGVGVLAKLSPFTAAGTSTASGASAELTISTATASGTSTASGVGILAKLSPFTAAGTSTASGVSAELTLSTATASGTSTASGASAELTISTATTSGTSTASGIGILAKLSLFAANATSTATATSAKLALSTASASATSTATAIHAWLGINAGGPDVSPFVADEFHFGENNDFNTASSIDLSQVVRPAPMAVYQTERYGSFNYVIPQTAGATYTVRLHFAEIFFTTPGSRKFNVTIQGIQVLTNFDVVAVTGGINIANIQEFTATADGSGNITIVFIPVVDNPKVNGIEIYPTTVVIINAGTATGDSSANATGLAAKLTTGSATGTSTATGISAELDIVTFTASGTSTATAIGTRLLNGSALLQANSFFNATCGSIVGPAWTRTTSDLGTILDVFKLQLDALLPEPLVYLGLQPDAQQPPQRSDQYVILTPLVQHVRNDYTTGGGRSLLVFDCDLLLTAYSRLDTDEHGARDYQLTDANFGLYPFSDRVMMNLHMFDPVDDTNRYILSEPLKVVRIDKPLKGIKPGWCKVAQRYTFSFKYALCQ